MEHAQFFKYRTGNTPLHKMPGAAKILLMLVLAIGSFLLPLPAAAAAWLCVIALSLLLRFSLRDIIADLQPAIFYCVLLYAASLVQHTADFFRAEQEGLHTGAAALLIPEMSHVLLAVHLGLSLSITALFYRSTSSVQFHEGFAALERAVTRQKQAAYADLLSLTLTFIPTIAANWQQIDDAWKARGGKNSTRKILTLVPLLFSVSMRHAYEKTLAIENRRIS